MTPDQLIAFIEGKMSMQHVYQPLLIKVLVESGGSATVRQLAQAILELDEAQIAYYSRRIKDMPVPVLKRHGVLDREGDLVSSVTLPCEHDPAPQSPTQSDKHLNPCLFVR